MKSTLLLLIAFLFSSLLLNAQYVNVPDSNFRSFLKLTYPNCFNATDQMDTTCSPIFFARFFTNNSTAENLDGLQYFKSLEYFYSTTSMLRVIPKLPGILKEIQISGDSLEALPTLPPSLQILSIIRTKLVTLPQLPASLKELSISDNNFATLPLLPTALEKLEITNTQLSSIPNVPGSLRLLNCNQNQLQSLPNSNNANQLESILIRNNQLKTIGLLPGNLRNLDCSFNLGLKSLPALPSALQQLICSYDSLVTLPLLPNSLKYLWCDANYLNSLPILPDSLEVMLCQLNPLGKNFPNKLPRNLRTLWCNNAGLYSLPPLPDSLKYLTCFNNNIECLPRLPLNINAVLLDTNKIKCIPNTTNGGIIANLYGFEVTNIPICNPTNNINQCTAFPRMTGKVYNDNNKNGILDFGDAARQRIKVQLSNSSYSFTDNEGNFTLTADTLGSYTVTVSSPPFYNALPLSYTHNLTSYTDVAVDSFALQANTNRDSLSVRITPITARARPGFPFAYHVTIENSGTTTLSPTLVLKFDSARIDFDSSSVATTSKNADSLTTVVSNLTAGNTKYMIAYFMVKTTAQIGDSLMANVIAKSGVAAGFDTSGVEISGSYDPNDKQATPELTPTQIVSGNYIDYTIRFQNTGNDTAFTVVLADTLSNHLQKNVLQMIGSSHLCRTTLNKGIIYFEFFNILLPDSNTNKIGSNGFVRFRIKPDSTVQSGSVIPNKASIYFDYNDPIVTNTCQTFIRSSVLPLKLLSFNARRQDKDKVLTEWKTANEINTSVFNLQRSNDGKNFYTVNSIKAKGRENGEVSYDYVDNPGMAEKSVFYRLEIKDVDGATSYSQARKISFANTATFMIYPNPAKEKIIIEGQSIKSVRLTDYAGRIILTRDALNVTPVTIPLQGIRKGLYMLQIKTTTGEMKTEKIVVE